MIEELRIADLGVINEATLELGPGLTVVTGETGAGKTMIITGLSLLLGGRADPRSVRVGAGRARVEGRLRSTDPEILRRIAELGGDLDDGELIIARHVTSGGRSRAYLGGAQVPASACAEVAGAMITIHGQSEQIRLTDRDTQLSLLDRFAGDDHGRRLARYRIDYEQRRSAAHELTALRGAAQERAREADLLRFGLDEIAAVDPQPGEDATLASEAHRLQSLDDLQAAGRDAMVALAGDDDESGGALAALAAARAAADRLAGQDRGAADLQRRVAEAAYLVTDVTGDLARYLDDLEVQPGRLEEIAARRYALAGLTRKYGDTADEVLVWAGQAAGRLAALEGSDDRIAELADRIAALDAELAALSGELTRSRAAAAGEIAERALTELAALAMPHARLAFTLTAQDLGPDGADQVDLVFSANLGNEPRSLAKVASGGELSRVRLAMEVVLAPPDSGQTLVFDEVDAGVGGRVAVEIGRRLASLARHTQVVVVTHLAQVAAFADRHFVVLKSDDGQVTTSGVRQVLNTDRTAELARMMAGLDTTDSSLAHAQELLALAASGR